MIPICFLDFLGWYKASKVHGILTLNSICLGQDVMSTLAGWLWPGLVYAWGVHEQLDRPNVWPVFLGNSWALAAKTTCLFLEGLTNGSGPAVRPAQLQGGSGVIQQTYLMSVVLAPRGPGTSISQTYNGLAIDSVFEKWLTFDLYQSSLKSSLVHGFWGKNKVHVQKLSSMVT